MLGNVYLLEALPLVEDSDTSSSSTIGLRITFPDSRLGSDVPDNGGKASFPNSGFRTRTKLVGGESIGLVLRDNISDLQFRPDQ
jgi:hypothetical protein